MGISDWSPVITALIDAAALFAILLGVAFIRWFDSL